ncbi:MAG: hypothetical protein DHS20C16_07340 [Phycisphaerae bacterium]|nr:MAG: hypothetical protein DHS20C16_07340 [Phycisphaerae bacterium]
MNTSQWQRLKTLFSEAKGLHSAQRRNYIDTHCADDPVMHNELVVLLDAHDRDDGFLAPLDHDELQAASGTARSVVTAGARIGRYEIDRLIATGGMGEVYLAKRADQAFEQQVAIKIIRQSIATVGMMQRFNRERQLLANLEHPNISRLLDGGATDDGLPYLVMEYISGKPITHHCNALNLTVKERLELFLTTCQAVQYAHQRLIVHRDIKPNNLLVTDDGQVKLLDFGISRFMDDGDLGEQPLTTITRSSALTPEYSSPEQVRGDTVTTSTDVYSLGVVLYEMLTGFRPYQLTDMPRYEAERVICEFDPMPPSIARSRSDSPGPLSTNGSAKLDAPTRTPSDQKRLRNQLRGDLDRIVMATLQKDPNRRYGSVEQLVEDIKRYFAGQPISARKDTIGYRVGKFVKRNKPQVAGATIATLALIAALVSTTFSLSRASKSERIAVNQTRIAQAAHGEAQGVVDFMETLLASASPFERGQGVTVVDLLDNAEAMIKTHLADRPGVEANVRMALARTHRNLMMYPEAIPHLEKSLAYFRETRDADDPVIAECLSALAQARAEQSFSGRSSSAGVADMQREALAIRRKNLGESHVKVADNLRTLAIAIWAEAHPNRPGNRIVELFKESLAMYESLDSNETAGAALCHVDLANAHAARGEVEQARSAYVEAIRIYDLIPGSDDQFSLDALDKYATFLSQTNEPESAANILETRLKRSPDSAILNSTKNVVWKLASLRFRLGQSARGEDALFSAMKKECELLRLDQPQNAEVLINLLMRLQAPRTTDKRIALFSDALVAFAKTNLEDPRMVVDQMQIVTTAALHLDGAESARRMLDRTASRLVDRSANPYFLNAIARLQESIRQLEAKKDMATQE